MKGIYICCLFALSAAIWSCQPSAPQDDNPIRGEAFEPVSVLAVGDFIDMMEEVDTFEAVVTGKVESVCQQKGCWMNLVDDQGRQLFVKFKDYGFFMPLDLSGQSVTMKGVGYQTLTSVEELRHYAEDEGLSQEKIDAITEPKEEINFVASGVILNELAAKMKSE